MEIRTKRWKKQDEKRLNQIRKKIERELKAEANEARAVASRIESEQRADDRRAALLEKARNHRSKPVEVFLKVAAKPEPSPKFEPASNSLGVSDREAVEQFVASQGVCRYPSGRRGSLR